MRVAGSIHPTMTAHARELRRNMTDAERALWAHLSRSQLEGLRFRRQQPIGPYIVDFYCHRASLVIELDGSQHREIAHAEADRLRDDFFRNRGVEVLRFDNRQVLRELPRVLNEIRRHVLSGQQR